jgi:probable rRNA maturation factor
MQSNKEKGSVQFSYADKRLTFNKKTQLKALVVDLFAWEKQPLGLLNYIFCSDAYLIEINRQYLQHDDYTDIITFGLSAKGEAVVGDIFISIDRVKENAKLFAKTFEDELVRVVCHGALHLCGYKDKKPAEAKEMRAKEELYIKRFKRLSHK